jgi:hypothetical protein
VKRGCWFHPGPGHRGSPPQPDRGVAPTASATRWAPRPRAAIEADLRALPSLRAGVRTGDLRADQLFGALLARRADRLLDELLRCGDGSEGAIAGSAAGTLSSAGSGTAASSAAVAGVQTTLRVG